MGIFAGIGEAGSVQNADTYLFGKFTAQNNEFQVMQKKLDLPRES